MKRRAIGLALAATMMVAGPANAAQFLFDYSFYNSDLPNQRTSASGTITATAVGNGSYLVQNVTGTWNGIAITGVAAINVDDHGNDNLIFPNQTIKVDETGFAFTVANRLGGDSGDGTVTVYYYNGGSPDTSGYTDFAPGTSLNNATFHLTAVTASAVPEPGVWALMLLGMGATGAALRRRRWAPVDLGQRAARAA